MDSSEDAPRTLAAFALMDAVPSLLKVLCEMTGMRVAVVARITDNTWTACAVKDEAHFGLRPGMQFPVDMTLFFDSCASRAPIVIEHASADPRYCDHEAPRRYRIESYISVRIIQFTARLPLGVQTVPRRVDRSPPSLEIRPSELRQRLAPPHWRAVKLHSVGRWQFAAR